MRKSVKGALLALAATVVLVGAGLSSASSDPSPRMVTGTGSCTTDGNGVCTLTHTLGVVPDTIVVSANTPGAFNAFVVNTVQESFTASTFRVRAMYAQAKPKTFGTIWVAWIASIGMGGQPPTTTPPPTTSMSSLPSTTLPSTTAPPPTSSTPPPSTSTTPVTTTTTPAGPCTNPTKIDEQDGRTFAAPGTTGQYYVHNDAWNWQGATSGQTEKLYLCNYNNWYVDAWGFQPSNGEVFMYPSTKWDATTNGCCAGLPLSTWPNQFTGRFAGTTNAEWNAGSYDVAWDLWLNGVADNGSLELMVWTQKGGQADPAGTKRGTFTAADGKVYDVWWDGAQRGGYLAFISQTVQTSGTVDLRAMITYASSKGYLPAGTPTVNQVNYGIEVRDTGSSANAATATNPARFTLTDFALTMK